MLRHFPEYLYGHAPMETIILKGGRIEASGRVCCDAVNPTTHRFSIGIRFNAKITKSSQNHIFVPGLMLQTSALPGNRLGCVATGILSERSVLIPATRS